MIHPYDLKNHIIIPTLILMDRIIPGIDSVPAIDLMCGTAAQASNFGHRLVDPTDGRLLGLYGMSMNVYENTMDYIQKTLIDTSTYGHTTIWNAMHYSQFFGLFHSNPEKMVYDLRFATIMARLNYWRHEEALPTEITFFTDDNSEEHQDYIANLATYWGTYCGHSLKKQKDFITNFHTFEQMAC